MMKEMFATRSFSSVSVAAENPAKAASGGRWREHAGGQLQVGQHDRAVGKEGRERGGELKWIRSEKGCDVALC